MGCNYYFSKKNNVLRSDAKEYIVNELETIISENKELALKTANFYLYCTENQ